MRQHQRALGISSLIAVLLVLSLPASAQEATESGDFAQQLAKADELLRQEQFSAAAEEYRLASELAGGASAEALLGLAIAELKGKAYERAADAARLALEATNDPQHRMGAYNVLGLSLFDSRSPGPEQLQEAERAFREVLELSRGSAAMAHFNLASVLRKQDRAAEALAEFREYMRFDPQQDMSDRARILICDLRRSLPDGAPPPRSASFDPTGEADFGSPETQAAEASSARVIGKDVQKPEKIFTPQPQFTEVARRQRIQGVVIVQAVIDNEGCVVDLKVLKGLPEGLSEQAEKAIRTWVFRPATMLGEPVDVYYNLTVNFRLQKRSRT